jgi:hypothetical protein
MEHGHDLEAWHEFALMLGGAAAVLLGLVFIAVSLHVDKVVAHRTLERRAFLGLANYVGIFAVCALILAPWDSSVLGWVGGAIAAFYLAINAATTVQARRHSSTWPLGLVGTGANLLGVLGAVSLILGRGPGLYLVAATLLINSVTATVAVWTLMVRLAKQQP